MAGAPSPTSPDPTEGVAGQTTGGTGDQALAQAIAAAVAAAVQTVVSQVTKSMDSLTEAITKSQVTTEIDSGTAIRHIGVADPADDEHRVMAQRDQIGANVQQMMTNMVANCDALMKEYLKYTSGVWARSLDHFSALPPIAPRSATGPGTSAA